MKNILRTSIVAATVLAGANIAYATPSTPEHDASSTHTSRHIDWDEEGGFVPQRFNSRKAGARELDDLRPKKAFKPVRHKPHDEFID